MPQRLEEGLILRRATPDDLEALADFFAQVFEQKPPEESPIAAWVYDLGHNPPAGFDIGDFTLVEDPRAGKIVSALCLISQTWTYAGIPFGFGRPEIVATHPDYRNRGLVRAQFEEIHRWSADRGELAQGITGIPWFYRQFGYEMALSLGGGRRVFASQIPPLEKDAAEPYRVRPAAETDAPFLAETYRYGERDRLVSCVRDEAMWRYELTGRRPNSLIRREVAILEKPDGEPAGWIVHAPELWRTSLGDIRLELKPGVSWLAATPCALRALLARGRELAERNGGACETLFFHMGTVHPLYEAFPNLFARAEPEYAWYLRVPDLPAFLRRIAPALEARLAGSPAAGYSGELKLSFYREGVRLVFAQGRITEVAAWKPDQDVTAFPGLTFLQLLFGYRDLAELRYAFPDLSLPSEQDQALLTILFPKTPSCPWPIH